VLGGALSVVPANFASQTANTFLAAPNGSAGTPSFRAIVAADIPTLNQSTTGSAATLTTVRDIAMTGDVSWTVSFNGSSNVTAAATLSTTARATGKQTIAFPASSLISRITNGARVGSLETTTNRINLVTLDFHPTNQEFAQTPLIKMPKGWNALTFSFEVGWYHPSATTNFGVVWSLAALAVVDGNALDTALGTAVLVTDTGGATNTLYTSAESAAVTASNTPAKNDHVIFQIARVPADAADTLSTDARLASLSIYYTIDAGNDA
jgi:hypothetical protein